MNATAYTTPVTSTDTAQLPRPARPVPTTQPVRPVVDAGRLWTGGLATAAVAALVGLVGLLVLRVLSQFAPHGAVLFDTASGAGALCLGAAIAALAATGVAHLLLVSTPRPLAYLGWLIGLSTAAATVLPFTTEGPLSASVAAGLIHLVIGMAIGSLVVNAAAAAAQLPGTDW